MPNKEIMQSIANVRNALFYMMVSREQTHVVSDCVRTLDSILVEINKLSAFEDTDK